MNTTNNTTQTTDARSAALSWWANQSEAFKSLQFTQYKKETFTPANFHTELTGREIEAIFTDLGLSERAIKGNALPDYKIWWNGLNEDEQYQLSCKHFVGIPLNTLMDKSIEAMYLYEHPQPLKEVVNDDSMEGFTGYELNLPDNLKEKGIMEFVQPILEGNTKLKATNDALVSALQDMVDNFSPVIDGRDEIKQDEILAKAKELLNNINNQ